MIQESSDKDRAFDETARPTERCTAPNPWVGFGITAGLAAIVAVLAFAAWRLLG